MNELTETAIREEFYEKFGLKNYSDDKPLLMAIKKTLELSADHFIAKFKEMMEEKKAEVEKLKKAGDFGKAAFMSFLYKPINEENTKAMTELACDGRQNKVLDEVLKILTLNEK